MGSPGQERPRLEIQRKRPGTRLRRCGLVLVCLLLSSQMVLAYPTPVVFAPTADAAGLGDVSIFVYTSVSLRPSVGAGATWFGIQFGVLPRIPYGRSKVAFGGLELGIDGISVDLAGTPAAFIKPILNAKLQLVTETKWSPAFAVGAMNIAPSRPERSLNLVYGSLTKSFATPKRDFGRVTLGLGVVTADVPHPDDPYGTTFPLFYATPPFPRRSRLLLLLGYESPVWRRISFGVDHLGGVSELSSTNVAFHVTPIEGVIWSVGGYLGSDPRNFYGGVFTYLVLNWNLVKTFQRLQRPVAQRARVASMTVPVLAPGASAAMMAQ